MDHGYNIIKLDFSSSNPTNMDHPFSLVPFMPLYGRQLQSGATMALIGPLMTFSWIRKSQLLKTIESNVSNGRECQHGEGFVRAQWHTHSNAHARKNKSHAFNFYAVF